MTLDLTGKTVSALGADPVVILAIGSRGFSQIKLRVDGQDVSPDPVFAALAAAHRRRIHRTPGGLNELRFAPREIYTHRLGSTDTCLLSGVMTDYAAWVAAKELWGQLSHNERFVKCQGGLRILRPHGIGVSSTVVCSDGRFLLFRRSSALSWYPDHWGGVAEGASIGDVAMGEEGLPEWDPVVTATRGLLEEVGLASMGMNWVIHSVVADVATGALSVLARAEVPFTSEEVFAKWAVAKDADEASSVRPVAWELGTFSGFSEQFRPLVPADAFALVGALALDAGWGLCIRNGWLRLL